MTQKKSVTARISSLSAELIAQWHPTRNGELKSNMVTSWSNIDVWWKESYDHEGQETIKQRAIFGSSCPVCIAANQSEDT